MDINKKLILFLVLLLSLSLRTYSQWSNNSSLNNAIVIQNDMQTFPQMTTDGKGGAIICWQDNRSGKSDIYSQCIDKSGYIKWSLNGVPIILDTNHQVTPTIASDGLGGAIIAWTDMRVPNSDIYAQRIDSNGNVLWNSNGVNICNANSYQNSPRIISDNNGGSILTWQDNRTNPLGTIYAQRLSALGNPLWANNGVALSTSINGQSMPYIVSDKHKGAIVTWMEYVGSNSNIYVQRIDSNGVIKWNSNGVPIVVLVGYTSRSDHSIIEDGIGGAILTWSDARSITNGDIYAQRIDSNGTIAWPVNGVPICTSGFDQAYPNLVTDGAGGAFITWKDNRTGNDIYAQHINSLGVNQWVSNGIPVCNSPSVFDDYPQIISDGSGGAIISWLTNSPPYDILSQKINSSGNLQWNSGNPILVCSAPNLQNEQQMISDNNGGAILSWRDERIIGEFDIYAQKVFFNGTFNSVSEIQNDDVFNFFPNPTQNVLNIHSKTRISSICIRDVLGNVKAECFPESEKHQLDVRKFNNGLYYLIINTDKGNFTRVFSIIN